ncbi:MAG: plastocyanin/azurin family copper-binding protein [Cyanobacteria bacterium J06555_13]
MPPSQQPIETMSVHLGNTAGGLVFKPNHLTFTAGKQYKLTLDNPSPTKHYFTAKDFADTIWTRKVDAGQVEVKGAIHELEIRPGAIADWVFIPQKPGTYELHCSIPGHAEAGMVGEITISTPAG